MLVNQLRELCGKEDREPDFSAGEKPIERERGPELSEKAPERRLARTSSKLFAAQDRVNSHVSSIGQLKEIQR